MLHHNRLLVAAILTLAVLTPLDLRAQDSGVVATIEANPNFSEFKAVMMAAGVTDQLEGGEPYTIFVPTDEAFAQLPQGLLSGWLLPEGRDELTAIIEYHIIPDSEITSGWDDTEIATTLSGEILSLSRTDRQMVNDATALDELATADGIVHVIDQVLIPPSLMRTISGSSGGDTDDPGPSAK